MLLCNFWALFERFRAILSHFQRHLSDFERQMRLVGTTSPIGSLNIESIFASPGPARTQHPASSLKIGIFIGIDQPSNDWRNRWNNFGGPYVPRTVLITSKRQYMAVYV
jgi:hypothetical protein